MKKLLLLRGAPASGKSTFIKDNNLEPYVISSDNLRLMVAGLSMDLDGNIKTSQDLDRKVWFSWTTEAICAKKSSYIM
jgi:2',3'-cyclic-nucleotide 3'-phosphodiesterase